MILNLDHNHRLHLVAALDLMEARGRREAFAVCRLQEKLDLNDGEREIINWRKVVENGREMAFWQGNGLAAREYDLSDDDIKRLCDALDRYPVVLARDKHWYLPLTLQLPQLAEKEDVVTQR